jgi:predicted nucleotide-binding protein
VTDIEKQKIDLAQLIANGHAMLLSLKDLKGKDLKDKGKVRLNFKDYYEHWYSEAHAVIKQMLPDRLTDFTRLYKDPKIKKATEDDFSLSDYVIGLSHTTVHDPFGLHLDLGPTVIIDTDGLAFDKFKQQISILEACKARFTSSLFDLRGSKEKEEPSSTASKDKIFIIHGHDRDSAKALQILLRNKLKLNSIILGEIAGRGRTLIEKFEGEAQKCPFAFAVFTPDDFIVQEGKEYFQARPNAIFELGWFYGKVTRANTCIIFKKGTKIHSDLEGISRIEFSGVINDAEGEIIKELMAAKILE